MPQEAAAVAVHTVFSLLQHEHKITVLNFTLQRNTEYNGIVRSKVRIFLYTFSDRVSQFIQDPLILCVGPRRSLVNPIYSQHAPGGKGSNNVYKFERYLRHGSTYVATIYGSVIYGKKPCVLLRETENPQGSVISFIQYNTMNLNLAKSTAPQLVAMGTFMNPDTTRIIAKRIILSGHPFKIHKKTATVRYMFFNPGEPE